MKSLYFIILSFCSALVFANDLPYNETASAREDIAHALDLARQDGKKVLVIFGANWCPDCRQLDLSLHGRTGDLINKKFIVVKVDVGNYNKNLDLSKKYGDPAKKGIPAAVVLASDESVIYSTKMGELSNAKTLGDNGIYKFFDEVISHR